MAICHNGGLGLTLHSCCNKRSPRATHIVQIRDVTGELIADWWTNYPPFKTERAKI